MIFLTIGSHQPFDRLVRAVDDWALQNPGIEIFGQITEEGTHSYVPANFEFVAHLPPQDYRQRCENAELIIAHAGMGSIITALSFSTPLVILPRWERFGEMRNDHQVATAKKFMNTPGIHVAMTEQELPEVIDKALNAELIEGDDKLGPFAQSSLTKTLRDFIHNGTRI